MRYKYITVVVMEEENTNNIKWYFVVFKQILRCILTKPASYHQAATHRNSWYITLHIVQL